MSWGLVAGAAISGAANIFGQKRANRTNQREAQLNRNFQERMRNSQWQAAVEDMRGAGLNPALAYQQGPNAAPSGAQASVENEYAGGVSSALQYAQAKAGIAQMRAGTRKLRAEAQGVDIRNSRDAHLLAEARARGGTAGIVEGAVGSARQGIDMMGSERTRDIARYELSRVPASIIERARAAIGGGTGSVRQGVESARQSLEQAFRDRERMSRIERWGGTFGERYRANRRRARLKNKLRRQRGR